MPIDHLGFNVRDFAKSRAFYAAALAPLGMQAEMEGDHWAGFGRHGKPEFWIGTHGAVPVGHPRRVRRGRSRAGARVSRGRARGGRHRQRRAGAASAVPPELLRRVRAGPGRPQHRGRLPRAGGVRRDDRDDRTAAAPFTLTVAWARSHSSPRSPPPSRSRGRAAAGARSRARSPRAPSSTSTRCAPRIASRATLDPRTTRDVLTMLGAALGIDPGRLRLDDRLDALWDMDPHAGFHQRATFEDSLVRRYPKLPTDLAPGDRGRPDRRARADSAGALKRRPSSAKGQTLNMK